MSPLAALPTLKASYERLYAGDGIVDAPRFYRWIVALLNPKPGQTLLDVACGHGLVIREAARRGLDACGLDLAEAAIRKARRTVAVGRFLVGNGEQLPFAADAFDVVTCLGSVENMGDPWQALAEIVRVAKPGGTVCLMMPNAYWMGYVVSACRHGTEETPFQEIERHATRQGWRDFIRSGGLVIERELRYNRPPALFRKGKMKSLRKFVQRSALNLCTPFNLSWSFVYLCRKGDAPPASPRYWLWEARQVHRGSR